MPTAMEAHIQPRVATYFGGHTLCDIWEGNVDIAIHNYLMEQKVEYTSIAQSALV